ncbi:MAG: substrate-binding domain-containing protein, partial [Patescibacteria group bacterium]|nr:substrate-binding domain-containing protein [Patescibacteria group bacterium]
MFFPWNFLGGHAAIGALVVVLGSEMTTVAAPRQPIPAAKAILGGWESLWIGKSMVQEFGKNHPEGSFAFSPAEGPDICRALQEGRCQIGLIAQLPMKGSRIQPSMEWNSMPFGTFAVAIIVNARNPVRNMTLADVADIFSGHIEDWRKLDNTTAKARIQLYGPSLTSTESAVVLRAAMQERAYANQLKDTTVEPPREKASTGEVIGVVANDARAVAFVRLTPDLKFDTRVRIVAIAKGGDSTFV